HFAQGCCCRPLCVCELVVALPNTANTEVPMLKNVSPISSMLYMQKNDFSYLLWFVPILHLCLDPKSVRMDAAESSTLQGPNGTLREHSDANYLNLLHFYSYGVIF
ncbi:hypothetical protein U1Q18_005140, partial [Sarracenia purpurea var. burkii]